MLPERLQQILRLLVEAYLETGAPIGSKTLVEQMSLKLSPATVRNLLADLEAAGLLYAPHTSAGRLPTEAGLRFFVDGLLEHRPLHSSEEAALQQAQQDPLRMATERLSGLAACAGMIAVPKTNTALKHLEIVPLAGQRALVILVDSDDRIENRLIQLPPGVPLATLQQAAHYLATRLIGQGMEQVQIILQQDIQNHRTELDRLAAQMIAEGVAAWGGDNQLIVRGQNHLLDTVRNLEDLERIKNLFGLLEREETMLRLLELTQQAEGVQIFIGSENTLFDYTGCSLIVAPLQAPDRQVAGAIGVIGPTRLNYGRIIPMVDYTATLVSSWMAGQTPKV